MFVLILAIESVILVPSARKFERDLLSQRTDHALIAIEPTLAASAYGVRLAILQEGIAASVGQYGISGVLVVGADNQRLAATGDVAGLEQRIVQARPMGEGAVQSRDGAFLDVAWPSANGVRVASRVDIAGIRSEVRAYTLRIAGLVALIVLVVTAGTMLVLHRLLLRPVLQLRRSSILAADEPGVADRHVVAESRGDEIGELVRAHNALLGRVAHSKRRDREIAEERARYLSNHDALSGLPNRAALLEHLRTMRTRKDEAAGTVELFLVNVRHFSAINAALGTARGDRLLCSLASRLRQSAQAADFVAHFGADRFAIARRVEALDPARAAEFAERLLACASEGHDPGEGGADSLAVRIGVASAACGSVDGNALITEAELALSRTRKEDAAHYEFYAPAFAEEAKARRSLQQDLERAIPAGELFVVLQPKLALLEGNGTRLTGAEVLVRWRHVSRGMVSPAEFIPIAEATGLVLPIGERVLADACALIRLWLDRHGWAPRLAVNLSARQFGLPDLDRVLARVLARSRIDPELLEVEITESAAMKDVARTASTLSNLRALGVKVSIDDFGTGYSSLAYLKRFAVDAIKIDKSFIDDIGADDNSEAICDAILRLGQALGCKVIAEGVETEPQVAFLRRRRCDEVQGYLFGKPVPAAEFESTWIDARAAA